MDNNESFSFESKKTNSSDIKKESILSKQIKDLSMLQQIEQRIQQQVSFI